MTEPAQRPAGIAIVVGSLVSVFAMGHHPSVSSGGTEAVAEAAREAAVAGVVHGGLIAMMVAMAYGLWVFAERLGLSAGIVRLGAVSYVLGLGAMLGATLISGFIVPGLSNHYAGGGADLGTMEAARHLMTFGFVANQVLAKLGAVATSAAIVLWSVRLAGRAGANRAIGWFGMALGAELAALLLGGYLRLDVEGRRAVV
ncbi:MAG: hypothetical protein KJZ47_07705, partial [Gemmatimonadales bacterium]|nr:hypothetical protein [Gemmatimonadales bacterium]